MISLFQSHFFGFVSVVKDFWWKFLHSKKDFSKEKSHHISKKVRKAPLWSKSHSYLLVLFTYFKFKLFWHPAPVQILAGIDKDLCFFFYRKSPWIHALRAVKAFFAGNIKC